MPVRSPKYSSLLTTTSAVLYGHPETGIYSLSACPLPKTPAKTYKTRINNILHNPLAKKYTRAVRDWQVMVSLSRYYVIDRTVTFSPLINQHQKTTAKRI